MNHKIKQGVSLIVLVITVIVMVILAGVIILTLDNSGIIQKAQDAVDKTNETQLKQIIQLGWSEAYIDGARTVDELKAGVDATIEENKLDVSAYDIIVTTSGVTIKKKTEGIKTGWRQEGLTVTNGIQTLEIGDYVAYDETNGGKITGLTETDWQVLGVNENGELLILSSVCIKSYRLGSYGLNESQQHWLTGPNILDDQCKPYGKGNGATGVKSIRVEDINKVIGYDPETAEYGKGQLNEYGNEVIYTYNGTTNPTYSAKNGKNGTLSTEHSSGFYFYNETEIVKVSDLITGASGTSFATLKNNYYTYNPTEILSGEQNSIEDTKAYKMLFGENWKYWLASNCICALENTVEFSLMTVLGSKISTNKL